MDYLEFVAIAILIYKGKLQCQRSASQYADLVIRAAGTVIETIIVVAVYGALEEPSQEFIC